MGYTENWYEKSVYGVEGSVVKFHAEYSYVHNPELIGMTPLDAVFKLIEATVPNEYETLDRELRSPMISVGTWILANHLLQKRELWETIKLNAKRC